MNNCIDTTYRSTATEIMDDFSMKGHVLRDTLDKLGTINKWLGGNQVTVNGVKALLKHQSKNKTYTIVDLGCGHGDMLRLIAAYGKRHKYKLQLIGIDANADAIAYANELSKAYSNIKFSAIDIFSNAFKDLDYDIAISTLFLHHFKDDDTLSILKHLSKTARVGIVVNDLHRSRLAYVLFSVLGKFISNRMIVSDGKTSILRAFKRKELKHISEVLNLKSQIRWQWAFRWQWLIFKAS